MLERLRRRRAAPKETIIPKEKILEGQTAIITGATGDIGRRIALTLAKAGANLVLNGRRFSKEAEALLEEVRALGANAIFFDADVSKDIEVEALVATAIEQFGRIDILVNNAGVLDESRPVDEMLTHEWERVMKTNATGAFLMTRAVVPHMREQGGGKIINISSLAGVVGLPNHAAYSASKAALLGLTRSNAAELGKDGIQVNAIAPGFVRSKMAGEVSLLFRNMIKFATPIRRQIEPQEVANTVLFYASELSSGTTGHVHLLDGGLVRSQP